MDYHTITVKKKSSIFLTKLQILQIISSLLILLWVYTAGSKLSSIGEFEKELKNQVFGDRIAAILLWLLPSVELLAAALLLFTKTTKIGLILSTLLMGTFTAYIALVLSGHFQKVPCSCGGVLKQLGWQAHLWFNLFFLSMSATGIWLSTTITDPPNKADRNQRDIKST
jgi:hypothetical protein